MKFTAIGRVTLDGVIFTIEAKDRDEAWAKAMAGEYVCYDDDIAGPFNWTIKPDTLESAE